MDVRCGRCGTEYEFDDALVSDRGTTVKCTNCGHQFKVHPSDAGAGAPERWIVRTASGRELVYTSLRELQRGIAQRQVGPEDLLSRGTQPPRPLGAIAELEPFFLGRAGASLRVPHQPRTLAGVAPPAVGSYAGPLPAIHGAAPRPLTPLPPRPDGTAARAGAVPDPSPSAADYDAPTRPVQSPLPEARLPAARVNALADTDPEPRSEAEPPTLPRNPLPAPPAPAPVAPSDVVIRDSGRDLTLTPTPSDVREGYGTPDEIPESRYLPSPTSRRVRSRWIAGLVVAGVAALLAVTVGRRYLEQYKAHAPSAQPAADARVAGFLAEAEKRVEAGDLEGAREQLDKASVLAERDAAVVVALVRVEALRADEIWLRLRLLDPTNKQAVEATHRQLGARVGKAKEALTRALQIAPDELAVRRARVDILRLAGELGEARAAVGPVAESPSADNAYVLAALDLAEATPAWAPLIDRLRTAAAAERGLGRARAALVYALVRSSQLEQAQAELDKVAAKAEGRAMLDDLRAFVARHAALTDAGTDAHAEVATVDPSSLPILDTSTTGEPEPVAALPGDFRGQLQGAAQAFKRGELDKAEELYNAVLAKEPGNTEAIAGLGDVARARKDPETAAKMYDKVLKENPSYLPALVARADQKWDAGDRKGAIQLYRRILEQAGPGTSYGQHASSRISAGEGAGPPPSSPAPSASAVPPPSASAKAAPSAQEKPKEAPPKPDKPKEEPPHIDTTDLPEANK